MSYVVEHPLTRLSLVGYGVGQVVLALKTYVFLVPMAPSTCAIVLSPQMLLSGLVIFVAIGVKATQGNALLMPEAMCPQGLTKVLSTEIRFLLALLPPSLLLVCFFVGILQLFAVPWLCTKVVPLATAFVWRSTHAGVCLSSSLPFPDQLAHPSQNRKTACAHSDIQWLRKLKAFTTLKSRRMEKGLSSSSSSSRKYTSARECPSKFGVHRPANFRLRSLQLMLGLGIHDNGGTCEWSCSRHGWDEVVDEGG